MRGHLKKRVAGKLLRRKRRAFFKNKPELMPDLELTNREVRILMVDTLRRDKVNTIIARVGNYYRKISRASLLRYNNLIYGDGIHYLWNTKALHILSGIKQYFYLKTIRSFYRTISNRFFRKKAFRVPRKSAFTTYRHILDKGYNDVPSVVTNQPKNFKRGFTNAIVEKASSRLRARRKKNVYGCFFNMYERTIMLRNNSKRFLALTRKNYSLFNSTLAISENRRSFYIQNINERHFDRAEKAARRQLKEIKLKANTLPKRDRRRVKKYIRKMKPIMLYKQLTEKLESLKKEKYADKLRKKNLLLRGHVDRLSILSARRATAIVQFRNLSGAFDASSESLSNKFNTAALKTSMFTRVSGLPVQRPLVGQKAGSAVAAIPYMPEDFSCEEDEVRLQEKEILQNTRLISNKKAIKRLSAIASRHISGLGEGTIIFRSYIGNAGNKHGAYLLHRGKRRNRKNHFSRRMLKYKKAFAYRAAIRWAGVVRQKVQTRNRMEFLYANEPITLAPKMFGKFTYRTAMLDKFFKLVFGDTLTYVYLHKTYLDNFGKIAFGLNIKSFVTHGLKGKKSELELLNEKIASYIAALQKDLKIKRNKNQPDYCYFLNARLYWNAVVPFDYVTPDTGELLIDIISIINYQTTAIILEQYKLFELCVLYKTLLHD